MTEYSAPYLAPISGTARQNSNPHRMASVVSVFKSSISGVTDIWKVGMVSASSTEMASRFNQTFDCTILANADIGLQYR
jgi:hypothetical protein